MDQEIARRIYERLEGTALADLRAELIEAAVRYARIRADWAMADEVQNQEMSECRTRAHDALIDTCNILSRNQADAGEENHWRETLGTDRKTIGDFACHLHCILGIAAR